MYVNTVTYQNYTKKHCPKNVKSYKDVVRVYVCVCTYSEWVSLPTFSAERWVLHLVSSTLERNSQIIQHQMCLKRRAVAMYLAYLWSISYTRDLECPLLCSDKEPKKCQIQVWNIHTRLANNKQVYGLTPLTVSEVIDLTFV